MKDWVFQAFTFVLVIIELCLHRIRKLLYAAPAVRQHLAKSAKRHAFLLVFTCWDRLLVNYRVRWNRPFTLASARAQQVNAKAKLPSTWKERWITNRFRCSIVSNVSNWGFGDAPCGVCFLSLSLTRCLANVKEVRVWRASTWRHNVVDVIQLWDKRTRLSDFRRLDPIRRFPSKPRSSDRGWDDNRTLDRSGRD